MDVEHDVGYFVILVSRAFMRVAEARLRPMGLGVAQMPVLVALASKDSRTQKEIAQLANIEQPTAAVLLQRMETAGLIERSTDPHDRRSSRITLSAHASVLLPKALAQRADVVEHATAGLSASEVESLQDLLGRVLANLESMVEGNDGLAKRDGESAIETTDVRTGQFDEPTGPGHP